MIYHVLPGDASAEEFRTTGIEGEIIVFREALIVGPIDADDSQQFWNERAQFILTEYGEDEIEYHDKVVTELETLREMTADDEVNLWFEYELFCSVNMWFCLAALDGSGASVYRVDPAVLDAENRWLGFGRLGVDDLKRCFESRQLFADSDLKLGSDLWLAFASRDSERMIELSENATPRFPYLFEVAKAAAEIETRPYEVIREIKDEGIKDFENIFPEFSKRAGVYGFGDLQVRRLLDGD